MSILSNELPSRSLSKDSQANWRASREWMVTGATNETDVLAATPLDGKPIPQVGTSHDQNALMRCDSVTPAQTEAFAWKVSAKYSIPPSQQKGEVSNLTLPAMVRVRSGQIAIAMDRDYYGNAITNSAGDALNPPLTQNIKVRYLRVVRWEPFYDMTKADFFENSVNSTLFTIGGTIRVPAQQCYCETIEIEGEAPADAQCVQVAYSFVLRRDPFDTRTGLINPFNMYPKDQGRRGWYTSSGSTKLGELFYADGTQVSEDIALDGTGKPINTSIKVGPTLSAPVANPNLPGDFPIATTISGTRAKYMEFVFVGQRDFTTIGL